MLYKVTFAFMLPRILQKQQHTFVVMTIIKFFYYKPVFYLCLFLFYLPFKDAIALIL